MNGINGITTILYKFIRGNKQLFFRQKNICIASRISFIQQPKREKHFHINSSLSLIRNNLSRPSSKFYSGFFLGRQIFDSTSKYKKHQHSEAFNHEERRKHWYKKGFFWLKVFFLGSGVWLIARIAIVVSVYNTLGIIYDLLKDDSDDTAHKALHLIEELLQVGGSPDLYYLQGFALLKLKRDEEALHAFDLAVKKQPDNSIFRQQKALALLRLKRYAEAMDEYRTIIKNDPTFILAYQDLAAVHLIRNNPNENDLGKARSLLQEVLKLDTKNSITYCNLGGLENISKNLDEAEKNYRLSIECDPFNVTAHINLISLLSKKEDLTFILAQYDNLLKLIADHDLKTDKLGIINLNKALILFKLNDFINAQLHLDIAMHHIPIDDFLILANSYQNEAIENKEQQFFYADLLNIQPDKVTIIKSTKGNQTSTYVTYQVDGGKTMMIRDYLIPRSESTLIDATTRGSLPEVIQAIENGDDFNFVNANYQTALDIAAEKKDFEIFNTLLFKGKIFTMDKVEKTIEECKSHYIGLDHTLANDTAALNTCIGKLLHLRASTVRKDFRILFKYAAHLRSEKGNIITVTRDPHEHEKLTEKIYSLENSYPEYLLGFRVILLIELIIKLSKLKIKDVPNYYTNQKLELILKQELLRQLETYHVSKIMSIINTQFSDRKNLLFDTLARRSQSQIKKLASQQQEVTYNVGYLGHSMYVSFFWDKLQNYMLVRYDNLVDGFERHLKENEKKNFKVRPYLTKLCSSEKTIEEFLHSYLFTLYTTKNETPSLLQGSRSLLDKIYLGDCCQTGLDKSYNWPKEEIQKVNNCIIINHNVGLRIRLGDVLYKWLINQEYLAVHDLLKPIDPISFNTQTEIVYLGTKIYDDPPRPR
jgi:tetratricopeptide (TPR) repeat protein